ncbi:MAG: 4Fe-4S binding protein, partial [Bacteroidaceae bacterium]|nr:4Fe-4S binding protein [Bacteroidaceae bacterium]
MLRIVRVIIATVVFALVTLLFFDFTGTMSGVAGWIPKIQFLPAVLALNLLVVAILVVLTLVCGRIYCSVICPLGIFQDVVSWLHGKFKKNRFAYKPEMKVMRYGFLILFVATLLLGFGSIAGIIEPYSAFGRIMSNIFQPLYILGNNALADVAEKNDSVMFYHVDLWWIKSLGVFIIAVVTFLIVSLIAWIGGRLYCNTVCPVG